MQTAHIRKEFIERNPTFIKRAVKIKPFANKRRLSATVQIEPPGGQRTADILAKFEEGGTKRPLQGRHLAIPVGAAQKVDLVRQVMVDRACNATVEKLRRRAVGIGGVVRDLDVAVR